MPKPMNVSDQRADQPTRRQSPQPLEARLRPSVRHPEGLPRCQRVRVRDGRWHQCERAARRGFRTCGFHGAGFAKRERAGKAKNPAATRLVTGQRAKLETLAVLAPSDPKAFGAYMLRVLTIEFKAMAVRFKQRRVRLDALGALQRIQRTTG